MSSAAENPPHPPHHPRLAHHFDSMEQQHSSAKLGMWLFLVTEVLLFSGLFLCYTVYRCLHPELFHNASNLLNVWAGTLNTLVLIGSSLTMALAVRAAQLGQRKNQVVFLLATLFLAGVFMVVKYFEYTSKFHHGIFPGKWFNPTEEFIHEGNGWMVSLSNARTFFSIYFMMTGLHGFHVVGGMAVIGWLTVRANRGDFNADYYIPVEIVGLYWHIVDIIWIFLFPLLYLVDRSGIHG